MIVKTNSAPLKNIKEFDDLRLAKKEQIKRLGANYFECLIPRMPKFTDRIYRYGDFEINLFNLTCTCDTFRDNLLRQYNSRDIRRLCIHLYYKLLNSAVKKEINPLTRLLMESAVKHNALYFYRYYFRKEKREAFFSFAGHTEWVNVFLQARYDIPEKHIRLGYNPVLKRWNYNQVPANHSQLEYIIEMIIKNQLPS